MTRPSAHRRGYTRGWRAIVRAAIEVHVRVYGWTCPGWCVPAHHTTDLTGDHELAMALGGLSSRGNVTILCRSCNARKSNRPPVRVQLQVPWPPAASSESAGPALMRGVPPCPVADAGPAGIPSTTRSRRTP